MTCSEHWRLASRVGIRAFRRSRARLRPRCVHSSGAWQRVARRTSNCSTWRGRMPRSAISRSPCSRLAKSRTCSAIRRPPLSTGRLSDGTSKRRRRFARGNREERPAINVSAVKANREARPRTALPVQEQTQLLEELRGGLSLQHQVIRARQRDVPRTRNLGRQQATFLRRHCAVTVAVDDQRRRPPAARVVERRCCRRPPLASPRFSTTWTRAGVRRTTLSRLARSGGNREPVMHANTRDAQHAIRLTYRDLRALRRRYNSPFARPCECGACSKSLDFDRCGDALWSALRKGELLMFRAKSPAAP
jgi:hypothetical protein